MSLKQRIKNWLDIDTYDVTHYIQDNCDECLEDGFRPESLSETLDVLDIGIGQLYKNVKIKKTNKK